MTLIFPAVIPSSHPVITWGRFPHVSKRSTGGRSEKIRLSNVNIDAEIQLAFKNISTEQLLQLRGHWDLARGTAREFEIHPALLQAMNQGSKDRLLATTWKFKDAPRIVDICGGAPGFLLHSLEITLKSQPRRVLSPVAQGVPVVPVIAPGARWGVSTSWQAGRAGINQFNLPGASWGVSTYWDPGRASIAGGATAPGAVWSVSTSWQPGGNTAPGAVWTASTSWAPGAASATGLAPGAAWAISTSWTSGAASVPPVLRPGAQWSVSTSWAPGGATVQTSAPGATWNVSTSWQGGAFLSSDSYFSNVSLLLHFDGNFTDKSSNNFSITQFANAQISTSNPKFGSGCLVLDGTDDYIQTPSNSAFAFSTGDFTVECFCLQTAANNRGLFTFGAQLALAVYQGNWYLTTTGSGGTSMGSHMAANTYAHIAVTRSGSSMRLFMDGNQVGNTLTNSTNLTATQLLIGQYFSSAYSWSGQIDEFRVTKGVARYTANFAPPTGAFSDS